MKILTVRQPFAGLIAMGHKTMEIRSWNTKYRGPVLIVAGKRPHEAFRSIDYDPDNVVYYANGRRHVVPCLKSHRPLFSFGKAICVVNIVDWHPVRNSGDFADFACFGTTAGQYAWVLQNPRLIEPFDMKGQLGLVDAKKYLQRIQYI